MTKGSSQVRRLYRSPVIVCVVRKSAMTPSSAVHFLLFSSLIFFSVSSSASQQSSRPKALLLPVFKDASTLQYFTTTHQRTPLQPIILVLDLGGPFLWLRCDQNYVSSTYQLVSCGSIRCWRSKGNDCKTCFSARWPGSNNSTVTHSATGGEVARDVVVVQSTNGFNPGRSVSVPNFVFSCMPTSVLEGLASGVVGMAGLGSGRIALPSQFSSTFTFGRKFAICLSSSNGVVFFGESPYVFLPNVDASRLLSFTPLVVNPVSMASDSTQGEPSAEYFIGVESINIDDKVVHLNKTLLSIDSQGVGGTKISTLYPNTVLEDSIYKAVTEAFISASATRNITRVASVEPFDLCFDSRKILGTRVGPNVPTINLVLERNVTWSIFGANSMVEVKQEVYCLGFVNGGNNPRTSIVIGGHQLENILVQFDLATSQLGFSSSLLSRQTTCASFNTTFGN